MSAADGRALDGEAHLRQSIADILQTRPGERIMLPEYGSRLPDRVDAPMNEGLRGAVVADTAEALGRWEPRVALTRVEVAARPGRLDLGIFGVAVLDGRPVAFQVSVS